MQPNKLNLTIRQIKSLPSDKLAGVLKNWRKIHYETVVLAYGESQGRKLKLNDSVIAELKPLYSLKNCQNMDELLKSYLSEKNCATYEELADKLEIPLRAEEQKLRAEEQKLRAEEQKRKDEEWERAARKVREEQEQMVNQPEPEIQKPIIQTNSSEKLKQLKELQNLLNTGAISQSEFDNLKHDILNQKVIIESQRPVSTSRPESNKGVHIPTNQGTAEDLNGLEYWWKCWKEVFDYDGRARRKEYWYFYLFQFVLSFSIGFLGGFLAESTGEYYWYNLATYATYFEYAGMLPGIAVAVRRMHDVGKSGWFVLIPIYNFVLAVTDGENGSNRFGPDPKSRK